MTVQLGAWHPGIEAVGTARAAQGADVAVEAAGVVKAIKFNPNDRAKSGQLLVQIDDAVERADLVAAEANARLYTSQLARAQALRGKGFVSQAGIDAVQAQLAVANSARQRANAVIDQKSIEARFDGTLGIARVDVGQYVTVGIVVVTLQDLDRMKVDFTIPEQSAAALKLGQPARFGAEKSNLSYTGRIVGVDPKTDPASRLIAVQAEVANANGQIRPGQFLAVRVDLPVEANVIALPQTAVMTSLYGDYVFVIGPADPPPQQEPARGTAVAAPKGGLAPLVAKQIFVTLGRRDGRRIEIVKGLKTGDKVVSAGQNRLQNGAAVTIGASACSKARARSGGAGPVNFSELFIRRPVLSIVVSLLILLLGYQGMHKHADPPIPGGRGNRDHGHDRLSGRERRRHSRLHHDADRQGGVDHREHRLRHRDERASSSAVQVRLRSGADPDKALSEVISKTQQVRRFLPADAEDPIITKGTGQNFAIMYLAFSSDRMKPREITEYLSRVIQPRLATVEGVADAQILGGQNFAMRIWLDPVRMASRELTANDIATAVRNANFVASPGKTENEFVAVAVEADTTLQDARNLRRPAASKAPATRWCACATSRASNSAPKTTRSKSPSRASKACSSASSRRRRRTR